MRRATWAAGDWDSFSHRIASVGQLILDRVGVEPGVELLDVGTGSGGTVAIPAALRGATVVGLDVTPELFEHARRRAAEAGVEVEWIEGDAAELPFADASFDRVTSTFGAMFAPDHAAAAAELVRVCRPGGRIGMTTWVNDGFVGEMFKLDGLVHAAPPPGAQTPPQWGVEAHVVEVFGAAGASPTLTIETVEFQLAVRRGGRARLRGGLRPVRDRPRHARAAGSLGRVPGRVRRSRRSLRIGPTTGP